MILFYVTTHAHGSNVNVQIMNVRSSLSVSSILVGFQLAEILELKHLDVTTLVQFDHTLLAVDGQERSSRFAILTYLIKRPFYPLLFNRQLSTFDASYTITGRN